MEISFNCDIQVTMTRMPTSLVNVFLGHHLIYRRWSPRLSTASLAHIVLEHRVGYDIRQHAMRLRTGLCDSESELLELVRALLAKLLKPIPITKDILNYDMDVHPGTFAARRWLRSVESESCYGRPIAYCIKWVILLLAMIPRRF